MQNKISLRLTPFVVVLVMACTNQPKEDASEKKTPFDHIENADVRNVLQNAIDRAGGWENWSKIKKIHYTKHSQLFLADSSVEQDVIQRHEYSMQPEFKANITWSVEGNDHEIVYDSEKAIKKINDTIVDSNSTQLRESVMSSLYVLCMPFKLLDAGTNLTYEGIIQFDTANRVHVIKATYAPDKYDNHSTTDEWYYYFHQESYDFLGCMVYHPPTYALIHNLGFVDNTPVKFHQHRKSYRSDSARNIKFLRAEFFYSDYEVE